MLTPFFASRVQPVANATGGNTTAPAWSLKDLDGKTVSLSDFKGKVVLLNFWATWCPPCRAEIPDLVALQNQYREAGLVVVGLSIDTITPAQIQAFAKRTKINYPVVIAGEETVAAYGNFPSIPTTFFVNREGKIARTIQGGADRAALEMAIKPLLAKPSANL